MNTEAKEHSISPRAGTERGGGKATRIKVDRRWIGAPEGTLTNPTIGLAVLTLALLATGTWGYASGAWPAWLTIIVNAVAIYVGFTVMHEAMHGVAHRNKRISAALGRTMGVFLTVSFPLFRAVHYEHHSHTNDLERDPDFLVSRKPGWLLPLYCLGITVDYRRHYYGRRLWRTKGELVESASLDVFLLCAIAAAAYAGILVPLLVVWIAPALTAVLALALAFDYLPHAPYDSAERYLDTRIYPGRILNAVLLGQNYHLIHHLWTTIPWFRYRQVFGEIESELEERGSRIGWKIEPLPEFVTFKKAA
jgi:beta-carotene hydroxylase